MALTGGGSYDLIKGKYCFLVVHKEQEDLGVVLVVDNQMQRHRMSLNNTNKSELLKKTNEVN